MSRLRRRSRILLHLAIAYTILCALLVLMERHLLYQPYPGPTTPEQASLTGYRLRHFTTHDGLSMPYWELCTQSGPVILYFHGNGGGLHAFRAPLTYLHDQGFTVAAMEYRGYPGAPGEPSEAALVADAIALYDETKKIYPDRPIVAWGYSLGSGVATQLAANRPLDALILEAPFSAAVDRAAMLYPFVPVHWLMRDQFLSREAIGKVTAPLFIMHGESDSIIPIVLAEQLYARANEPKQFLRYPQANHMNLIDTPAYGKAVEFLRSLPQ